MADAHNGAKTTNVRVLAREASIHDKVEVGGRDDALPVDELPRFKLEQG